MSAVNIGFFPLLYFFSIVYYTDVGSTFMVLLMYCLHLDKNDWFASFIGALAVLFRQTNIVWVFFVAIQAAGPHIIGHAHEARIEVQKAPLKFSLTTWGQTKEVLEGLFLLLFCPRKALQMMRSVLQTCIGYLLVGLAFVAFVIANNGVVVGDRTAHTVMIHPTQVLYFCAFSLVFSAPYSISRIEPFLMTCKKHWLVMPVMAAVCVSVVKSYTLAHQYLLADNRHYTFYIWRKIIVRADWTPLALTPIYLYGGFCILYTLRRAELPYKLAYPLCILANLVPQYLLEFRYFVIPFIFYRLQVRPQTWWKLWAEFSMFAVVNAVTFYLFLFKPFHWDHEPNQIQRFMW